MVQQRTYVPKWLTESKRDKRMHNDAYVENLKKVIREIAMEAWQQKGGKDSVYLRLRQAYFGEVIDRAEL